MKKSKKLLALLLSLVMLTTSFSVAASAVAVTPDDDVPTILLPGLFQSETKYYENGKVAVNIKGEPYSAPFFMDTTEEIVGAALTEALVPICSLLINQEDKEQKAAHAIADILGDALMSKQKCDENGQFINDIRATKYNASFDKLSAYDQETILDHFPMQYYIDNAGGDMLYVFSYASLDNMISTVKELYDFIQFVKKDSGYDKVNLVPVSQGGSIAVGLLQYYSDLDICIAEDINRIVYVVPAYDGSTLVGEVFENGLLDEDYELYRDMFPALLGEDDIVSYLINIVLRLMPNADINNILDIAVDTLVNDYMRYSTLLWGLCPTENYPASREKYLTDGSTVEIVKQTDWFYNAQLNADSNNLHAVEHGVKIFDIVDYNVPLYHLVDSWDDVNADGIIQLDSTSMGAYSMGVDVELPEDYVPAVNNCTDPEHHDHSDPHNLVDARTGLFPETTFYFYGQNHEYSASNDVLMKLASTLLFDENFTSVYTYPEKFPQFNTGRNTKKFSKAVNEMRSYDTSKLSDTDRLELEEAIIQADAVLDNTIVDLNELAAAETRFYNIRDKIKQLEAEADKDPNVPTEDKENTAYLDFSYLFTDLFKILSDILYRFFGGAGFGDM